MRSCCSPRPSRKNHSRAGKRAARGGRSALAKLEQRMEDGKNHAPMSELAAKVKIYKKQIEEAEVITAVTHKCL